MTDSERMRVAEPNYPPCETASWTFPPPEPLDDGSHIIRHDWCRWHVSYLHAVGTLAVLSEQLDPGVRMWCDPDQTSGYRFSVPAGDVDEFFREKYVPAPICSPWNGRSFGPGFNTALEAARPIPRLSEYVRVVDESRSAYGEGKPSRKGPNRGDDPKQEMVVSLVTGKTSFSPRHTRWCRACWRVEYPEVEVRKTKPAAETVERSAGWTAAEKPRRGRPRKNPASLEKPKKEKAAPKPDLSRRRLLGSGGCAGSLDYGSLYLRAAVEFLSPPKTTKGGKPLATEEFSLGGLAFPLDYKRWSAMDVLLLIEGAVAFASPWPIDHDSSSAEDRWFAPHAIGGSVSALGQQGIWMPIWNEPLDWPSARDLLATGWQPEPPICRREVFWLMPTSWAKDAQFERLCGGGSYVRPKHRATVKISSPRNRDHEWWRLIEWRDCEGEGRLTADGQDADSALAEANRYIADTWGDLADVTVEDAANG